MTDAFGVYSVAAVAVTVTELVRAESGDDVEDAVMDIVTGESSTLTQLVNEGNTEV